MDNRLNNGGHSTKSKDGKIDKRRNEYRSALKEAASKDDVVNVIKMLLKKATEKQDVKAAQLFLEYYIGKPKDSVDITTNGESIGLRLKDMISFK